VALETDSPDSTDSTAAAIKIMVMRQHAIDLAAAVRALPPDTPVAQLAEDFLIPAVKRGESSVRQLTVIANVIRQRHTELHRKLTDAHIKSQSTLSRVAELQRLNMGELIRSSKASLLKPANGKTSPLHVTITKHLFPRFLVLQATIANSGGGVAPKDIRFVVAESTDDLLGVVEVVKIRQLPANCSSSSYCVLRPAGDRRLDVAVTLTCELRYVMAEAEGGGGGGFADRDRGGKVVIEEMEDVVVLRGELS
jgi:hypothetical protein